MALRRDLELQQRRAGCIGERHPIALLHDADRPVAHTRLDHAALAHPQCERARTVVRLFLGAYAPE